MNTALGSWGFHIVGQAGFKMGALLPQDEVESLCRQQAARIEEALFQAISRQHFLRPSFLSLLIFKIQQRSWQQEMPGSVDYTYWQDQG